ncbi:11668_t:CDS:2 [Ambispora leptoticha]|uniref:11668_t:CDS:1 n=1 Tax=Ambispora leptoticha TaxID=144679 RepID=A0A9N9BH42_9GLOM|nr:11668_t:CDS:2 [Ambispora leptoticha]
MIKISKTTTGSDLTAENTNNHHNTNNMAYSSSPTHSIYLAPQQQEQHEKRRKRHKIKHLRHPPAFDTYLRPRSNSCSSSDGSRPSSVSQAEEMLNNPSAENEPIIDTFGKALRRVSSALKLNGLIENSDFNKLTSGEIEEEEWEPEFEESSSSESEEEFIMNNKEYC